jgi:hypothetical protein
MAAASWVAARASTQLPTSDRERPRLFNDMAGSNCCQ